jgi:hypothetical protein
VNARGEHKWFVRIEIAGLYPRRLGPFSSTDEALEFYEETLRGFLNDMGGDFDVRCIVEDELGSAYLSKEKRSTGLEA